MKNDTRQPFLAPFRADRATAVLGIVVRMTVDNLRQKAAAAAHGMSVNTTVRALTAYDHSDWVNAPSAKSWHLYHVFHGQIDFGGAETAYFSSGTM